MIRLSKENAEPKAPSRFWLFWKRNGGAIAFCIIIASPLLVAIGMEITWPYRMSPEARAISNSLRDHPGDWSRSLLTDGQIVVTHRKTGVVVLYRDGDDDPYVYLDRDTDRVEAVTSRKERRYIRSVAKKNVRVDSRVTAAINQMNGGAQ